MERNHGINGRGIGHEFILILATTVQRFQKEGRKRISTV